jgi:hypothetical protein
MMDYIKAKVLPMKGNPQFINEAYIQNLIARDPSILGLGELELKEKERIQPGAGRLDILLKDSEDERRYEIEVQLGSTDPSHIIRTIEYWEKERRRYPNIEHIAVIVAEEINSRFFNVISLFNQHIPLIAIQMTALEVAGKETLIFTRVLNTSQKFRQKDDEVADGRDWKQEYLDFVIKLAEEIQALSTEVNQSIKLKFNKEFIGITINNKANNFIRLKQLQKSVRISLRLEQTDEVDALIENNGFEVDYDPIEHRYRLPLKEGDVQKHRQLLLELIKRSYSEWFDEVPLSESSSQETEGIELNG